MSWLDLSLYCADLPLSVLLLFRIVFTRKIQQFEKWNVVYSKHSVNVCLQAIAQYIAYSWKTEGGWENKCKTHFFTVQQRGEATKNRPWLIVISFKIYLESFPIQKLFNFLKFSLLYKCPKSLSKSTLMSLNWKTAFKQEITKWRLRWSIRPPDVPFQLFQRLLWNH